MAHLEFGQKMGKRKKNCEVEEKNKTTVGYLWEGISLALDTKSDVYKPQIPVGRWIMMTNDEKTQERDKNTRDIP